MLWIPTYLLMLIRILLLSANKFSNLIFYFSTHPGAKKASAARTHLTVW